VVVVAVVVVVVVAVAAAPTVAACQTPTSLKPSPFTSPRFLSWTNVYSGSPRYATWSVPFGRRTVVRATRPVGFVPFGTSSGCQKETHVLSGEMPELMTFPADAKALVIGIFNGSVKLWQLDGPGEAATFPGHSGWIGALALLPDGQTLISAGGTDLCFWDVRTRRDTSKLNLRAGMFCSIALSGDGRRLAAGASDGRISIWDVASHQELATFEGHKYEVMQLAFTPDGDHLVSASKDQLRVWSAISWAETDSLNNSR